MTRAGACLSSTLLLLSCHPTARLQPVAPLPEPSQAPRPEPQRAAAPVQPAALPTEVRAVWLTHYEYMKGNESTWAAIADDLVRSQVNTVYLAMYADARPLWDSAVFRQAAETSLSEDWARRLVPVFKSRGLRVGAWFEYGLAVGDVNAPLARLHPDWLSRDLAGNVAGQEHGMVFLSPGSSGARNYITAMVQELTRSHDWDEIQLDRFRYTRATAAGREFGYEIPILERFLTAIGQKGTQPMKDEAAWVRHREMAVNGLVEQVYRAIKEVKPTVVVSSAPVGHYGIQQHMQRWGDWLCGGYLDLVIPQIYEKTLDGFRNHFKLLSDIARGCGKLDRFAVGVDGSEPADATLVEEQLSHARSQGVRHASLWVYHTYTGAVSIRDNLDYMRQPGHIWANRP